MYRLDGGGLALSASHEIVNIGMGNAAELLDQVVGERTARLIRFVCILSDS